MRSERPFSIDRFVAKTAVIVAAMSPLWLLTAPAFLAFLARERRLARSRGLHALLPFHVRTLSRYARVMIGTDEPEATWDAVARRIDAFLASHRSPRAWRLPLLVLGLEIAPCFTGRLPASLASRRSLRRFCETRLATSTGLWGRLSLIRQLIRMAYFDEPALQDRIGYVPLERRVAPAKAPSVAGRLPPPAPKRSDAPVLDAVAEALAS